VEAKKIICVKWIGRFGNKCHSYLYGKHIENKFGLKFYIPGKWEGSYIFKNPSPVFNNLAKEIKYAGGSFKDEKSFHYNKKIISLYNERTGDNLELVDPCLIKNYGKSNIAYTNLVTDAPWFYPKLTLEEIKKYFQFNEQLKKTDLYQELYEKKGTYDVAHLRRTDIAGKNYNGGHMMVSKKSYINAFSKFDQNQDDIVWVSDEPKFGWKYKKKIPDVNGRQIAWLPDFLKLVFARRIFRSNSSFSLFAGWISDAEIFAPMLHKYDPCKEHDFQFVCGNHPHWMAVKGVHNNYMFDIGGKIIDNSDMEIKELDKNKKVNVVVKNKTKNTLMMVHWNGRFGNRLSSYSFGKSYADKYNSEFIIPSEWEGTHLFKEDASVSIINDDKLRQSVNQTHRDMDNLSYRSKAVREYCNRENIDQLNYMNPDIPDQYGNTNVFFDSLAVNGPHIFKDMSAKKIKSWYEFNDKVKNLDVYKRLEDIQGTYDIAHLRRDDISSPSYNKNNHQGYSVISKLSYLDAFKKFDFNEQDMQWTTDDWTGNWGVGKPKHGRGGWSYPTGSKVIPEILFDWLPDFLRLYFARTIFRANSSFSWWAAFLSPTAKVYAPVLSERKIYFSESDEVKFEFVEGNYPHWLNVKNNSRKFADEIIIPE
jgi:hypothetical protein